MQFDTSLSCVTFQRCVILVLAKICTKCNKSIKLRAASNCTYGCDIYILGHLADTSVQSNLQ